jgi:hypothetical protein
MPVHFLKSKKKTIYRQTKMKNINGYNHCYCSKKVTERIVTENSVGEQGVKNTDVRKKIPERHSGLRPYEKAFSERLPVSSVTKIPLYILHSGKCQYETQGQKEVPGWCTGPFRALHQTKTCFASSKKRIRPSMKEI